MPGLQSFITTQDEFSITTHTLQLLKHTMFLAGKGQEDSWARISLPALNHYSSVDLVLSNKSMLSVSDIPTVKLPILLSEGGYMQPDFFPLCDKSSQSQVPQDYNNVVASLGQICKW